MISMWWTRFVGGPLQGEEVPLSFWEKRIQHAKALDEADQEVVYTCRKLAFSDYYLYAYASPDVGEDAPATVLAAVFGSHPDLKRVK
jgi:hypothetical protein